MIQSRPNQPLPDDPAVGGPGQEPQDRLKQHGDEVKRAAQGVTARAGEVAADAGDRLKEAGRQAKDQAMALAGQATDQVRSRADTLAQAGTSKLAGQCHVFGDAFYRAAERLEEEGGPDAAIGSYARTLGDCCESVASYLENADSAKLLGEARTFTRRHPEVVLGGLFLAGLAAARFLKASDRRERDLRFGDLDLDRGPDVGGGYAPMGMGDYGYGMADAGYADDRFDDDLGYADHGVAMGEMIADDDLDVTSGLAPLSREDRGMTGAPDLPAVVPSFERNTDLTASIAPQPGSYPPSTPSLPGTSSSADSGASFGSGGSSLGTADPLSGSTKAEQYPPSVLPGESADADKAGGACDIGGSDDLTNKAR